MPRDTTFTEIERESTVNAAAADFVMDEDAFRGFYERNARGLWGYLARITGDREAADDLLQETFYRFLRAAAQYESDTHRRNSLYRIATNLARDAQRRSVARMPGRAQDVDIERVPSGQDAGTAERGTDFSRAMSNLKPRERALLWLAYAEGASHREIADVMGLRPGSLKPMLSRARQRLAALLRGNPREDKR